MDHNDRAAGMVQALLAHRAQQQAGEPAAATATEHQHRRRIRRLIDEHRAGGTGDGGALDSTSADAGTSRATTSSSLRCAASCIRAPNASTPARFNAASTSGVNVAAGCG